MIFSTVLGVLWPNSICLATAEDPCNIILSENAQAPLKPWVAPSEISKILKAMEAAKDNSQIHPDKIGLMKIDKLPVGTVVFLDTSSIGTKALKTEYSQSVRFTVKANGKDTIDLYNPQYGTIHFDQSNISDLYGNLYQIKNFRNRTAFLPGEYIQLGWPGIEEFKKDIKLTHVDPRKNLYFGKNILPFVAKFIRALKSNEYEIELPQLNKDRRPERFRVSRADVYKLNIGHGKNLKAALDPLNKITKSFAIEENVRFRDKHGFMQSGQIMAEGQKEFLVRNAKSQSWVSEKSIFKTWTTGEVSSISIDTSDYYYGHTPELHLENPSGFLAEVLNGAANLASHPQFLNSPMIDQLKILVRFEQTLLPWGIAGDKVELAGLSNYSQILCSGAGVCRHNTPIMAAILSEAGLKVRIYYRFISKEEIAESRLDILYGAHTWLEAENSSGEIFVIDPSSGTVKTQTEVQKAAEQNHKSSDAIWWNSPKRKELSITKQNSIGLDIKE